MGFDSRVYSLLKRVPQGKVTTYKEIANALNMKGYRAVGQALKRNRYAPSVPCQRVVKSDGSLGGYGGVSAEGVKKKIMLLQKEVVEVRNRRVEMEKYMWKF